MSMESKKICTVKTRNFGDELECVKSKFGKLFIEVCVIE
ncbi:hypothetical protein TOT_020000725 [Theileria orientalis strain Shintoku]|uniref:Uncharacterized protein n=1 Tax=Theileria orientalis strain Shintoku TaxID=869250 RepID=J4DPC6_THEOR|nr:hypothetical protein TOT_020000725 [Theileria orientalis strain Shintoku]PVC51238.1 hypothetical protein MACL_00001669 [Theileria orientalis]BAM40469.1 hypothetical protein TOT_020000725 [Theileria orientalis strain Shintoku]|eukprot:XP_009690770.1 hypothetical protein TOT_020000725 [Theileria orientalis strain Shintoku]